MGENELQIFRLQWRVNIIERLVFRNELSTAVLERHLSLQESTQALLDWLDINSAQADVGYGKRLRDPAMVALFVDEVKEAVEEMKTAVGKISEELQTMFQEYPFRA